MANKWTVFAGDVSVGTTLATVTKSLDQDQINRYATAGGDHNPLHTDGNFAASTEFGGTIAHGMLMLAFLSEMLTANFGAQWMSTGKMKVRFRAPGRPGQNITCGGTIADIKQIDSSNSGLAVCDIVCKNGSDEILVDGKAEVVIFE